MSHVGADYDPVAREDVVEAAACEDKEVEVVEGDVGGESNFGGVVGGRDVEPPPFDGIVGGGKPVMVSEGVEGGGKLGFGEEVRGEKEGAGEEGGGAHC